MINYGLWGRPTVTERDSIEQKATFRVGALPALLYFLPFLAPYAWRVALICLTDVLVLVLRFIPPWFGTFLLDRAFPDRDWQFALLLILSLFGTEILIQGMIACRNLMDGYMAPRLAFDLKRKLYTQLQRLSIAYTESEPVGQRVYRIRWDSDMVANVVKGFFPTLVGFLEFSLLVVAAIYLDMFITAVALGLMVPWAILSLWITGVYRDLDRKRLRRAELRDSGVLQGVSSFALIKAYGRQQREIGKHIRRSVSTQRVANRHYLTWWWFDIAVHRLIPFIRNTVVTLYLYRKVVLGELTLGVTIPMIAYITRLAEPVTRLIEFINSLRRAMIPAERCMQLLMVETAVPMPIRGKVLHDFTGWLRFEGVTFRHHNGSQVLTDVSFEVRPGERVAVVGPSGAGKSTIASLAVRLHDPAEGRVLADGLDLREANLSHLLQQFAVVTQESFIFGGSLEENLRYGRNDATDEELWDVLSHVGLHEWAQTLPKGLEHDLESGSALSVGQRQRIGVARALLNRPRLLILDEPTSALDSETEASVMDAIWKISKGLSVLFISHRLNTVMQADRILVLQDGRIVEEGSPPELLERNGAFRQLYETYTQLDSTER